MKLVQHLIANTKGDGKKLRTISGSKAERLLYCALIGYICYEAPEEEKNFITLLEMINASEAREDDEEFQSPVDLMFAGWKKRSPTISPSGSTRNTSWRQVLYALKDFLIKRLGSLLEHTT